MDRPYKPRSRASTACAGPTPASSAQLEYTSVRSLARSGNFESQRISRSKRKSAKRKRLVERLLPMMEPVNVIAAGPDNKPTTPPENTLDTPLQPQSITPKTWRPSFRFVIEWTDFPIVKSLLALAGILGFLIAIFVLRPLPYVSSPLMTHEKDALQWRKTNPWAVIPNSK